MTHEFGQGNKGYWTRGRRITIIVAVAFAALLTMPPLSTIVTQPASAAKPAQHVGMGDLILQDAADGSVTIDGLDYPVNSFVLEAVLAYPAYYKMGTIGPDAFPDIFFGQTVIHPPEGGAQAYDWTDQLIQNAVALYSEENPMRQNYLKALAFAYGFMTHTSGDMFFHTYINRLAGGAWELNSNAVRHLVIEQYVNEYTKLWLGDSNPFGSGGVNFEQFLKDQFFVAYLYYTFIGSDYAREYSGCKSDGLWDKAFAPFLEIRDSLNSKLPKWDLPFDERPWYTFIPGFKEYLEHWIQNINEGMMKWIQVSMGIANELFIKADGSLSTVIDLIIGWWKEAYLMTLPPGLDNIIQSITDVQGFLKRFLPTPIYYMLFGLNELIGYISNLISDATQESIDTARNYIVKMFTGKTFDEWTGYMTRPANILNLGNEWPWSESPDSRYRDGNVIKAIIDQDLARAAPYGQGGPFDPNKFDVTYNTITMGKLLLLDGHQLNELMHDYGCRDKYTELTPTTPWDLTNPGMSAMRGFIKSLDGDHQWMINPPPPNSDKSYGTGMPMWEDSDVRERVFKKIFHMGTMVRVDPDELACNGTSLPVTVTVHIENNGNMGDMFTVEVSSDPYADGTFSYTIPTQLWLDAGQAVDFPITYTYSGDLEVAGNRIVVKAWPQNHPEDYNLITGNEADSVVVCFKNGIKYLWATVDEPKRIKHFYQTQLQPLQVGTTALDVEDRPIGVTPQPFEGILYVSSKTPFHFYAYDEMNITNIQIKLGEGDGDVMAGWTDLKVIRNADTHYVYAGYEHKTPGRNRVLVNMHTGEEFRQRTSYWWNLDYQWHHPIGSEFYSSFPDIPYNLYFKSTTATGEEREDHMHFVLDNTPPESQLVIGDPKTEHDAFTGVSPDTHIAIAASDVTDYSTGSGYAMSYFRIVNPQARLVPISTNPFMFLMVFDPITPWIRYTGPFSMSSIGIDTPDRYYGIEYYSVDRVQNKEVSKLAVVTVLNDTAPPVTVLSRGSPCYVPAGDPEARVFVGGATPLSLNADDHSSSPSSTGVKSTKYMIEGPGRTDADWVTYSGPFTLGSLADGTYNISFCSEDNKGNVEDVVTERVVLDNTDPISMLIIGWPRTVVGDVIYVKSETGFRFETSDWRGAGVLDVMYTIASGSYTTGWVSYTGGTFHLPAEGNGRYTLTYGTRDNVLNQEELRSVELVLANAQARGHVFLDRYNGGVRGAQDPEESGLGNWRVTLQGRTMFGAFIDLEAYTSNLDDVGSYLFGDLPAGEYWLNCTLLAGFYATTPLSAQFEVGSMPEDIVVDFGVVVPAPDPEFNFILNSGWNMWSTPIAVEGLTAKGLLGMIGPEAVLIMRIDAASNSLQTYMVGDDQLGIPDFPIVLGEGYYVYVSEQVMFSLKGVLHPGSSKALGDGWNFIGYSSLSSVKASQLLAKVQGGHAVLVMGYNPITGNLDTYVVGDDPELDFMITPGRAYFIWVSGDCVLPS